jgi:hypothetical protein
MSDEDREAKDRIPQDDSLARFKQDFTDQVLQPEGKSRSYRDISSMTGRTVSKSAVGNIAKSDRSIPPPPSHIEAISNVYSPADTTYWLTRLERLTAQAPAATPGHEPAAPITPRGRSARLGILGALVAAVAVGAFVVIAVRDDQTDGIEGGAKSSEPSASTTPPPTPSATPSQTPMDRLKELPGADSPPVGPGPFPYVILDTENLGVFVRTGPGADDRRLPGNPMAAEGVMFYADCKVVDGFEGDRRALHDLRTWLKIRWPERSDVADAWVYGGFSYAVGHNGDIPICEDTP